MPYTIATKKYKADEALYKATVVKNDITCAACGTNFKLLDRNPNKIEEYLGVVCCPSCGYPNPYIEELVGNAKCIVLYGHEYSIGYEIEFFIPKRAQENFYDSFISGGLKEGFGHDGAGNDIKEYRSAVFTGYSAREVVELMLNDLSQTLELIKGYGGKLSPARWQYGAFRTFGIHVSFGNGFSNVGSTYFFTKYSGKFKFIMNTFKKLGTRSLFRITVGAYREHENRVEVRLLDSSEKNILALSDILHNIAQIYEG